MAVPKLMKAASQHLFRFGERIGVLIVPNHYYVPLASPRALRASRTQWNHPIDIQHLPMSFEGQRELLLQHLAPFKSEYEGNQVYHQAVAQSAGPGYGFVEAQALHAFVRATKPRRIIEVGSGVSTFCMLNASRMNELEGTPPCEITCIEPNPRDPLRRQPVTLIAKKVEEVDLDIFDQLASGDLLFIDSSHALRPCGDVQRIYLDILPRLKRGVLIHIHDIFIPYPFQRNIEETFMQWMENALLISMLNHSARYEIIFCQSYLHYAAPELLREVFPEYRPAPNNGGLPKHSIHTEADFHFPSATFLRIN